ncbi:MAG: Periplasmic protein involved in polysaccharide export [Acidobacteria bacterium]|jgi:polysaccharide export outer membrane protein|nr:Periplasmic protein involved in polysaccharide export [Acidobacteriota bacterium]
MKAVKKLLAFCAVLFLANVAFVAAQEKSAEKPSDKIENVKKPAENPAGNQVSISEIAASGAPNPYKNQVGDKYRLGFQDTVEIQVFRHPELSQVVNINPDGTIRMPRIDQPIVAVCKTERELGDSITSYYKTYLKNPFVTVRAVEQRSQPFAVVGAVKKAGSFYLNRKIRLLELLAFAGGPDVEFAGSKIQIARVGNASGCTENSAEASADDLQFIGFNLNDVLKGKENPWMEPGDIVSVLIAEEAYVVGNVLKPTKVTLNEPRTLTQALAIAGGTDSTANTSKVIIQRQEANGVKKELLFDLKDIRDRKIPDPQLQANDIVQVSNDKMKSIMDGVKNIFKSSVPTLIRGY